MSRADYKQARLVAVVSKAIIRQACEVLNKGGIIAFPTDTVYGIGCDAFNEKAIKKIYEIKKRNIRKPLILFVGKKSELKKYVYISPRAKPLIKNFWPGALTIVFRSRLTFVGQAKNKAPQWVGRSTCSYPTLSVRIPSAEPILTLLRQYNRPLATTSANIEGERPPTSHKDLKLKQARLRVDFVIPGTSAQIPSTIVDVSSQCLSILREGKIKSSQIYKLIK